METRAAVMEQPGQIALRTLQLREPEAGEMIVEIDHAGVSTGTETLLWNGAMPQFPGLGYPLVPGYESVGRVVDPRDSALFLAGDPVFVPGAHAFADARALFGANARHLVVPAGRAIRNDVLGDERGVLLALAATAHHALCAKTAEAPGLIVGHGTLGRLLARIALARGMECPTVWETAPERRVGDFPYPVVAPDDDRAHSFKAIYDCTGDAGIVPFLIDRLEKGGELVLAGFYPGAISFPFAPAFMREARLRIAAEWSVEDMDGVLGLIGAGLLDLDDLITHRRPARELSEAYPQALSDTAVRKMVLDWSEC